MLLFPWLDDKLRNKQEKRKALSDSVLNLDQYVKVTWSHNEGRQSFLAFGTVTEHHAFQFNVQSKLPSV